MEDWVACPGGDPDCPEGSWCLQFNDASYCSPFCTSTADCPVPTSGDVSPACIVDGIPRTKETRSAVLHRGVHLRMARDKRRARGEKC